MAGTGPAPPGDGEGGSGRVTEPRSPTAGPGPAPPEAECRPRAALIERLPLIEFSLVPYSRDPSPQRVEHDVAGPALSVHLP